MKREEQERRTSRAEELLIEKPTASACISILMAEFGIRERAAWRYLAKARARWDREAKELGTEARMGAREEMRRTLQYIKSRGFLSGELRVVLGATKQLRDLDGLDVPKELRLSGAFGVIDASNIFAERTTEDLISFLRTARLPPESEETAED